MRPAAVAAAALFAAAGLVRPSAASPYDPWPSYRGDGGSPQGYDAPPPGQQPRPYAHEPPPGYGPPPPFGPPSGYGPPPPYAVPPGYPPPQAYAPPPGYEGSQRGHMQPPRYGRLAPYGYGPPAAYGRDAYPRRPGREALPPAGRPQPSGPSGPSGRTSI